MMRMAGVSYITATATALLPCFYNGTILRRRSLRLRNGGSREPKLRLRCVSPSEFDFSPPPIDHDPLDTISVGGGIVSEDGVVESFDNDDEALDAFDSGVVVVDLSHFGRIRVSGDDRVHFLHNQTTANFECLSKGQGCDTVFVTPTARTIDIAHAWIMKNAIMLMVSPTTCQSIIEMLNKCIFFADKVEIKDITKQTYFFALAGPKCNQIMSKLNLGDLIGQPYGKHQHYSFDGMPITVGVGSLISDEGFTMLMSPGGAVSVWKTLLSEGAVPMGSEAWEKLRVLQGRPAPERELSKEFNVLEAGLWNSISLNKGCYKGQETIARLITYDGIKQRLCGLELSAQAEPGSTITFDGKKVGKLTSYTRGRNGSSHFGLGYIKKQAASVGTTVTIGEDISGIVAEVPYLSRQHPPTNPTS
ncbi:PREDICTED: putative transferase At1g60990, chloroplastic [Brassica oleracea var. oleracea]|uniref:Aminomethyltransferase folate-binding domain-containing protein n=1 Tax=Brassica oleracea var. oleracea TaxID=109376 RepID=A0A0D3AAI6_BRAOL|nr:PREDICTED: putative transferase At1g60990, chloroplastic [Brassica oleracea var. oleracea]